MASCKPEMESQGLQRRFISICRQFVDPNHTIYSVFSISFYIAIECLIYMSSGLFPWLLQWLLWLWSKFLISTSVEWCLWWKYSEYSVFSSEFAVSKIWFYQFFSCFNPPPLIFTAFLKNSFSGNKDWLTITGV